MVLESELHLEALKEIGRIVADTLQYMISQATPGKTTDELDREGLTFLQDHGARSAPMLVYDFPGATCISVNEHGAHGIPKKSIRLKEGDLVNIDVSAEKNGFFADTGASFVIEPAAPWKRRLCEYTLKALHDGLSVITDGTSYQKLGQTIETVAQSGSYRIIENLGSHGVGRALHEEPHFIPSFFNPNEDRYFQKSQVITLEPFLSTGSTLMTDTGDGWTLTNGKGFFSAQYEHSLVVTDKEPILLTVPTAGEPFTKLGL